MWGNSAKKWTLTKLLQKEWSLWGHSINAQDCSVWGWSHDSGHAAFPREKRTMEHHEGASVHIFRSLCSLPGWRLRVLRTLPLSSDFCTSVSSLDRPSSVCVHARACECSVVSHSLRPQWTVACHGISQARILEWVVTSSSRESSWPRNGTRISFASCLGRQILYHRDTWGAPLHSGWASTPDFLPDSFAEVCSENLKYDSWGS